MRPAPLEPVARAVQDQSYSIFAPDICKVNGKFYIYYPTSNGENYVVTADRIEGPWTEPVKLQVSGIDPGHAIDDEGNRYLYTNNGFVAPLSADGLTITGQSRKVYDPWQYPEHWETEGMWLESPKILKRGDFYYLVSAEVAPLILHQPYVRGGTQQVGLSRKDSLTIRWYTPIPPMKRKGSAVTDTYR